MRPQVLSAWQRVGREWGCSCFLWHLWRSVRLNMRCSAIRRSTLGSSTAGGTTVRRSTTQRSTITYAAKQCCTLGQLSSWHYGARPSFRHSATRGSRSTSLALKLPLSWYWGLDTTHKGHSGVGSGTFGHNTALPYYSSGQEGTHTLPRAHRPSLP